MRYSNSDPAYPLYESADFPIRPEFNDHTYDRYVVVAPPASMPHFAMSIGEAMVFAARIERLCKDMLRPGESVEPEFPEIAPR